MTEKQKRMKKAVERLQKYMETYDQQSKYLDYSEETFIDDVLYGLGVALDHDEYSFFFGFQKFKKRLVSHLTDT